MLKRTLALALWALTNALSQQHTHSGEAKDSGPAPLLAGLGDLHHAVTTSNPEAQRYFDQGLTLVYGFNHEEGAISFRYAAKLDPKCAMAYWGIALARGPNYNESQIDADRAKEAWDAIQKAKTLARGASANEQAYIDALAKRFSSDPKADRKPLDTAYAQAMRGVMKRFPDDLDAAVLFADAAMDLHPWQLWKHDGQPEPGTAEVVDTLESVLKRDPKHIGANHFYIHAMEASAHPELALDSANRLAGLAPGAGHLVHMPGHIYIRTGDYRAASLANEQAVGADRGYFNKYHRSGMYSVMYYTHNLHFLAITSSLEGRFDQANRIATKVTTDMTPLAKEMPMAEAFVPTRTLVLVRFRKWPEIENLPEPDQSLHVVHAVWRFARGMAFSGDAAVDKAAAERAAFTAEIKAVPDNVQLGYNSASKVFQVAGLMLDASIARARGDKKHAVELLTKAAQAEDALNYDEPPDWYLPPRESLGAVLYSDGRYGEAETTFRAELKAHARNPRALFGLAESLKAQGKSGEEASVRKEFEAGWKRADTQLRMADL
jgi:tetratricopeptide (TPR) repeat protein